MDDIALIEQHEQALRRAMLANDVDALADLLDDELVFTGPDGRVLSKEDDLSAHRDKLLRLSRLDTYETKIHRIGDSFLTTTKAKLAGQFGATSFDGTFAYTRLWRRFGAGWRISAGHASQIG